MQRVQVQLVVVSDRFCSIFDALALRSRKFRAVTATILGFYVMARNRVNHPKLRPVPDTSSGLEISDPA
jgi:hypothetical protein